MYTFLNRSYLSVLISILINCIVINGQNAVLKHSYTFDDGTSKDIINSADGIIHGNATISSGAFITSSNGQYLELPANKINFNRYPSFSIETFLVAGKSNGVNTMLAYFGDIAENIGNDYFYLSLLNGGSSKAAITCKNPGSPWESETSARSIVLSDGKPHYLVTTFDNAECRLYIDGVLVATAVNSKRPLNIISNLSNNYAFLCKGGYSADPTWKGSIDFFNIYEGILDSNTIVQSAKKHLPGLDVEQMAKYLNSPASKLVIDESGSFKEPITGEQIIFAEIMPLDNDDNNRFEESFILSGISGDEWYNFSVSIRLSSLSGYLDVLDRSGYTYNQQTKLMAEIGEVYQCWVHVDMNANTYSVYAKTVDQKSPVLIYENAKFKNNTPKLTNWSAIHNTGIENDAMHVHATSLVNKIGDFPQNYTASVPKKKTSVLEEKVPNEALVIENPKHGYQEGNIELKKIVITDEETSLYLRIYHSNVNGIFIPDHSYIKPSGSNKSMFILRSEGIPMNTNYYASAKGYSDVKLVFPPMDISTQSFEYGEAQGTWFIYDILFASKESNSSNVLYGNWFNTQTGDWEFSLLDSVAIYQNERWFYTGFEPDKKKGDIILFHGNKSVTLYYKRKGEKLLLGKDKDELHELDHDSRYTTVPNPSNPPAFAKPLFKMDTAVFTGYYYGYRPTIGSSTGNIYVDNVLTGDQENYLVKINDDGTFSLKIPITYPHEAYVRMNQGYTRLFLEPGKKVFVLMNLTKRTDPLIMGANARLMTELMNNDLADFYMNDFYSDIYNQILDMIPEKYKYFCMTKKEEDLEKLKNLYENGKISDRYYQIMNANIISYYTRNVLHYHYTAQSAYRQKFNGSMEKPAEQKSFSMPPEPDFYNFVEPAFMNNELSLLGSSYENLINAFKYSPVVRSNSNFTSFIDVLQDTSLLKEGHKEKAQEIVDHMSTGFIEKQISFTKEYNEIERSFRKAYSGLYEEINKNRKEGELPIAILINQAVESDTLSNEYKDYCKNAIEHYSDTIIHKALVYEIEHGNEINEMYTAYSPYLQLAGMSERSKTLREELDFEEGITMDIFNSQDILRSVVNELTPLSDKLLEQSQQKINHPFIRSYLASANEATIATIEANKAKGGYTVNEVPETEADKLFEAIISKYKGNVIYVDFWATWCGPCRSSMQRQTSMKEAFKGKDVVFVYITNPTSPENTYKNMIPNIHGEHYRVSNDEWSYLTSKFNITGIPHYLIVNKKGEIVDANAPREPSILTERFEELLQE